MDAARTALRIGAEEVILVYRRSLTELPARKEEVHHAQEEGVRFELCTNPVRILGDEQGQVRAVECVRMDLCELDESGRRSPKPIKGSEFEIPVNTAIVALGTGANPIIPQSAKNLQVNKRLYIVTDEQHGAHEHRRRICRRRYRDRLGYRHLGNGCREESGKGHARVPDAKALAPVTVRDLPIR